MSTSSTSKYGAALAGVAGVALCADNLFVSSGGTTKPQQQQQVQLLRGSSLHRAASECPSSLGARLGTAVLLAGVGVGVAVGKHRCHRGVPRAAAAFDPAEQLGAMQPLGFFDPLGFCKENDLYEFKILRAAEIKHGRVAMMASIGLLGEHFVLLPGVDRPEAGLAALANLKGQTLLFALFIWSGVFEVIFWEQREDKEAGNFGDPLGVGQYNPEMRLKELNNGRFAMICVAGIVGAELATGRDAIQQLGF